MASRIASNRTRPRRRPHYKKIAAANARALSEYVISMIASDTMFGCEPRVFEELPPEISDTVNSLVNVLDAAYNQQTMPWVNAMTSVEVHFMILDEELEKSAAKNGKMQGDYIDVLTTAYMGYLINEKNIVAVQNALMRTY